MFYGCYRSSALCAACIAFCSITFNKTKPLRVFAAFPFLPLGAEMRSALGTRLAPWGVAAIHCAEPPAIYISFLSSSFLKKGRCFVPEWKLGCRSPVPSCYLGMSVARPTFHRGSPGKHPLFFFFLLGCLCRIRVKRVPQNRNFGCWWGLFFFTSRGFIPQGG